MKNEFEHRNTLGGWCLALRGDMTKVKMEAIDKYDFSFISIKENTNKDLSWLERYRPKIKSMVVDAAIPQSLSGLCQLEKLTINDAKGEYPTWPNLRCLTVATSKAWHPSINQLTSIEFLRVHGWPEKDLSAISSLSKLISLHLVDSRKLECLAGCEHLKSLESLILCACSKLSSCVDLQYAPCLHYLNLESCKAINDFEFMSKLSHLIRLYLALPKIPSLEPLRGMPNLKSMNIGHTLVEDLNTALLKDFPQLLNGAFCNKRGYNAKHEEIEAFFRDKWDLKPDSFKGPNSVIGYEIPQFSLSP